MKIGIISDSHKKAGRSIKAIDFLIDKKKVDYIIHAGDIVKREILEHLENRKVKYLAVLGNNDNHLVEYQKEFNLVQEPYYFKLNDLKIKLMHHPFYLVPDVDIVIFGHTHISEIDYKNRTLFVNSGEICGRDTGRSEAMILEITKDKYIITQLWRVVKNENWSEKKVEFIK